MVPVTSSMLRSLGALGDEQWTVRSRIRALAPSPDGRHLWALTDDAAVAWEVASGRLVREVPGAFTDLVAQSHALLLRGESAFERWSYEGRRLDPWQAGRQSFPNTPTVAAQAEALVWTHRKALTHATDDGRRAVGLPFTAKLVRVSPRGEHTVVFASDRSSFVACRLDAKGELQSRPGSADNKVFDVAPLDDGTCLFIGNGRRLARVRLDTMEPCWVRKDASRGALRLSADGRYALVYSSEEAHLIRVSDGATRATFHRTARWGSWSTGEAPSGKSERRKPDASVAVALAPDASWVALAESDGSVQCFDATGATIGAPRGGRAKADGVAWAPDGRALFTYGSKSPEITEWSWETREPVGALEHASPGTDRVIPSPDGRHLAVLCRTGEDAMDVGGLLVIERASGATVADLLDLRGERLWGQIRWTPDASALVVLTSHDPTLWVVSTSHWKPRLRWKCKTDNALLLDVDREAAHLWVVDAVSAVPLRGDGAITAPTKRLESLGWIWNEPATRLVGETLLGCPTGYPAQWPKVVCKLCRWDPRTKEVVWVMGWGAALCGVAPSGRWFLASDGDKLSLHGMDDGRALGSLPALGLRHAALSPRGDAAAWLSGNGVVYRVAIDVDALERSL